jgi:uncharacterized membrane protein YccC
MKNSLPKSETASSSWFAALKHSWQATLRIDRSQFTAFQAIRSTIGIVLPLAIGVATGHVLEGVSMAGGAAILAGVGLTYTYRARTRTMLLDCLGVALSAFVGSITGPIGWLSVLVTGIWGAGAGLMVAISPSAMLIGLQSTIALIILTHFKLDPAHAAIQAALMFAGALLQAILTLVPSPWKSTAPERVALSMVYQKLADYADSPKEQSRQQARDALLKAQSTLADSNPQSQQGQIFSALLALAEHIRLSLILLSRSQQRLAQGTTAQAGVVEQLDQIMQSAAEELRKIPNELKPSSTFTNSTITNSTITRPYQQMKEALTALRQVARSPDLEDIIQQALVYADALGDQLRRAKKLAKSWKHAHRYSPISIRSIPRQAHLQLHSTWEILQANLTLRSATFRHAIRLGVALALATALYRLLPLPLERGYWIPVTTLLVLRSDFTTTFTRGLASMLGTMLGAVLAALLASILAPTQGILVIVVAITAYLAFSVLLASYAIFSVFITMEVVFFLAFVIPQSPLTAAYRAIDTAIGGILALLIYLLWPTWEHSQVLGNIADRLEAIRLYFATVMECYAHPDAYDESTLHNLRIHSRLARSNAAASVQRSLEEPKPHRTDLELAQDVLDAAGNIVGSVLTLEAYLLDNPSHDALPAVTGFSNKVDEALRILATSIREGQPVTALPNLQEALRTLQAGKSGYLAQQASRTDLHFVLSEAKGIISTINAISQLLSTKYATVKVDNQRRK